MTRHTLHIYFHDNLSSHEVNTLLLDIKRELLDHQVNVDVAVKGILNPLDLDQNVTSITVEKHYPRKELCKNCRMVVVQDAPDSVWYHNGGEQACQRPGVSAVAEPWND